MIIETSKDILYITLALAVLWITVFLCWALYYVIMIFHDTRTFTKTTRDKFNAFWKFFDTIKDKIEKGVMSGSLISQAVIDVVDYLKKRGGKKAGKKKKEEESNNKEGHSIKIAVE